jgi:hypothetical protein
MRFGGWRSTASLRWPAASGWLAGFHDGSPVVVGIAALAWAATLAPRVVGRVSVGDLFESYAIKSEPVEEGREMGGLLIVAVWMAVLALAWPHPTR